MMRVRKGDNVIVIAGKYRGKKGEVKRVLPDNEKVVVEGVNVVKRHVKPRTQLRQAGIIEVEAPIHISNVMLVCPQTGEPTRVGYRIENGEKVRFAKVSGAVIPDNSGWRSTKNTRAE
jgi:large subunit ribosomal protein L24